MGLLNRLDAQKKQPAGSGDAKAAEIKETAVAEVKSSPQAEEKDVYADIKRTIHVDIIREMNREGNVAIDRGSIYKMLDEKINDDEYKIP